MWVEKILPLLLRHYATVRKSGRVLEDGLGQSEGRKREVIFIERCLCTVISTGLTRLSILYMRKLSHKLFLNPSRSHGEVASSRPTRATTLGSQQFPAPDHAPSEPAFGPFLPGVLRNGPKPGCSSERCPDKNNPARMQPTQQTPAHNFPNNALYYSRAARPWAEPRS